MPTLPSLPRHALGTHLLTKIEDNSYSNRLLANWKLRSGKQKGIPVAGPHPLQPTKEFHQILGVAPRFPANPTVVAIEEISWSSARMGKTTV